MSKIEKALFATATMLGLISMVLLIDRGEAAAGTVQGPTVFCDFTAKGLVKCRCSPDAKKGTVCVGNNVKLYWCTTTATAPCAYASQKQCPVKGTGFEGVGNCTKYKLKGNTTCVGDLKNDCK